MIDAAAIRDARVLAAQLGDVLRAHGFTVAAVRGALGGADRLSPDCSDVPEYVMRLPGQGDLAALIKLLLLGVEIGEQDARDALAPLPLAPLERAGLLEVASGSVNACVRIMPHNELLLVSDRHPPADSSPPADYVGGVHGSTALLTHLAPRPAVSSTLDLGTGCGVHALMAAPHSRRVVATDTNPRALAFTEFNAVLNHASNVECRRGSLFNPLDGERFDLLLSNPPYVISPDAQATYSASSSPGDRLCERLVRGLPDHLTKAGIACVLASWCTLSGQHWSERPRGWLDRGPSSQLLFHVATVDADTNARRWARPPAAGAAARGREVQRWIEYYRSAGIDSISYGAVVVRHTGYRESWTRAIELATSPGPEAGGHVLRLLEAHDWLAYSSDDELLDSVLALSPDHTLELNIPYREGVLRPRPLLRLTGGLPLGLPADRDALLLVSNLDGRRILREALTHAGVTEAEALNEINTELRDTVSRLAGAGLFELRRYPRAGRARRPG